MLAFFNAMPAEHAAFLCGIGPFFLMLTAGFVAAHYDGVVTHRDSGRS